MEEKFSFGQDQNQVEFGAHLCDIVVCKEPDHLARFWVRPTRGSPQRSAPTHLRTLALLGANVGFFFEFLRGLHRTEGIPWGRNRLSAGDRRGKTCDLASSVCLFTEGVMGPRGCVRTTPRVSLQNSQPGQGHFGGRLWPARRARPLAYFRGPAPHRQLSGGTRRRSMDSGPSLGKAVAHCLSSAPRGWHGAARKASELPAETLMRVDLPPEEGIGNNFMLLDLFSALAT